MEKRIGKIQSIRFGFGGYQDVQFGVSVTLGSKKDSWAVGDFKGPWATEHTSSCKWTEKDRTDHFGEVCRWTMQMMRDANVSSLDELKGVPVEVTFDGNTLKEWRILSEVI